MFILSLIGALGMILGALAVWAGYNEQDVIWMASGLSSVISGILFIALDKGLTLLKEIRDALVGEHTSRVEE
ncbi:hypothetical protein EU803_16630 [Loktanella sp. IMCC34160]|uniref:hypothetical protein n=1 Tax=Loktanella sp. IMCC34160 TaxID=2510646 RepID=UPI00101C8793|nr:hypothetical protein [Loktanella sp. IMCC34160]RYG89776.1 hypothetical protein EU803_16630 [Loktanella sp. IMCC34160]